jgi:hypothetical protein
MDLLANAAIHAQRLDDAARRLGLSPDLVDGLGDHLYEAAVVQLDVASKILERSQLLVDRLFDLGASRGDSPGFRRVDVKAGEVNRIDLVVHNALQQTAQVDLAIEWDGGQASWRVGQPSLPGHRDTAAEIELPATLVAGKVYPMVVKVSLTYDSGRRVELPPREYEIWVRG